MKKVPGTRRVVSTMRAVQRLRRDAHRPHLAVPGNDNHMTTSELWLFVRNGVIDSVTAARGIENWRLA
jgi:hypothetical protein